MLVVDDDDAVRTLFFEVLAADGYDVYAARSADEALRLLDSAGMSIDLLISDLVMPGVSGVRLAQALRADNPDLPILVISGYPGAGHPTALSAPIRWLEKPIVPTDLTVAVRELLDRPASRPSRSRP